MTLAIHTDKLTRRFGTRLAVSRVSLNVPELSVYGFLGRNGAGKTTTLRMLLGLLKPDTGRAFITGKDVARDRIGAARRVGALLDAQGFYDLLSGRANLDLFRRLRGCPASEIDRVLEITELRPHAARRVADYSLGMRQRLGLARAMLGAPPVMLLDEPTNGLDPEGIADMRSFLRELPKRTGTTVLLSSHLLSEIEQTATHVGILSHGRLVLEGELHALKAGLGTEIRIHADNPAHAADIARSQGFQVERVSDTLLARLPANTPGRPATAALNKALCEAGIAVHAITPNEHSLETLYRQANLQPQPETEPF